MLRFRPFLIALCLLVSAGSASATQLTEKTRKAFATYVTAAESRMQQEIAQSKFLWTDSLGGQRRDDVLKRLKNSEIVSEKREERLAGESIPIPYGMVHHWIAMAFVPGATMQQTVSLLQDYDHHKDLYKPEVVDSKLLSRNGDRFRAYLRFYKKKVIGVTLNTEHDAQYKTLSRTRAESWSHTTKVAEVENAGTKEEREKPQGDDSGFLWALNSYWRIEEKDGGVYVQCEAISLTRDVPTGLGWMIKPFITEVPKESLYTTMNSTRQGLLALQRQGTKR
jgi:hypothetical protein